MSHAHLEPNEGRTRTLSAELAGLLERSGGRGLSTREILDAMASRGIALLMVVFSAPFLLPVSIPGTSAPFGLMLGVLGLTMVLDRPPWVPGFVGDRKVPHASLEKVVKVLLRFFGKLERWLHVRHVWWVRNSTMLRVHGLYIAFMAAVLAIPFPPVPFVASNSIAAWPIFLLGLGLLERDGVFVGLAYAWLVLFCAYWLAFYLLAREAFDSVVANWNSVTETLTRWLEAMAGWFS